MSTRRNFRRCTTSELVSLYTEAASEHGKANRTFDYEKGNPAADRIAGAYRELRRRGLDHQRMLLPLLLNPDVGVRSWAAAHALEFEPSQGEAVLAEIAKGDDMVAFGARVTLDEWRKGRLSFP